MNYGKFHKLLSSPNLFKEERMTWFIYYRPRVYLKLWEEDAVLIDHVLFVHTRNMGLQVLLLN
jgi:hypothetical protein